MQIVLRTTLDSLASEDNDVSEEEYDADAMDEEDEEEPLEEMPATFSVSSPVDEYLFFSSEDEDNEEEELLDYSILPAESALAPPSSQAAAAEGEEKETEAVQEDLFYVRDYLRKRKEEPQYPRLDCFGAISEHEMTEEESLLHHHERISRLADLYGGQFRRLYDSLQSAFKQYRVLHRELLFAKRMEQGGYSASLTTDAGGYGLTISASSSSNPTPMTEAERAEANRHEEDFVFSSLMKQVIHYTDVFREENLSRKQSESEYAASAAVSTPDLANEAGD